MKKGFAPTFDGSADPIQLRNTIQAAQERMATEPGVTFVPDQFGDMDAELSVPENSREDAIIIYIHGGGLICGNAFSSRGYASMLAGETKIPVYAFFLSAGAGGQISGGGGRLLYRLSGNSEKTPGKTGLSHRRERRSISLYCHGYESP